MTILITGWIVIAVVATLVDRWERRRNAEVLARGGSATPTKPKL